MEREKHMFAKDNLQSEKTGAFCREYVINSVATVLQFVWAHNRGSRILYFLKDINDETMFLINSWLEIIK